MTSHSSALSITRLSPANLTQPDIDEWVGLFDAQAAPGNPFLHPIWTTAWLEQFVDAKDREIFLVRRTDTNALVGVAPMYRHNVRLGPASLGTRLMPVGSGLGPNALEIPGLLADAGLGREVTRTVVAASLASGADWCEVAITPAQGWFEPEWVFHTEQPVVFNEYQRPCACVVLPLADTWEKTRGTLKRNIKESIRRSQNRIAKDGRNFSVKHLTGDQVSREVVARFLKLHRMRSKAEQTTITHPDAFADSRNRGLVLSAIPRLAAEGLASLVVLELDHEMVAAQLALHAPHCTYVHSSGFRPDLWPLGPITLLQAELVKVAVNRGDAYVNFSPGPSVSKLRWSEQLWVSNEFVYGAGPRSLGLRYSTYKAMSSLRKSAQAIAFMRKNSKPPKSGADTNPSAGDGSAEKKSAESGPAGGKPSPTDLGEPAVPARPAGSPAVDTPADTSRPVIGCDGRSSPKPKSLTGSAGSRTIR